MRTIRHEDGTIEVRRPEDARDYPGLDGQGLTCCDYAVQNFHLLVLYWTVLYGFVIFPNHPSPDMLECHQEVYYNNQTEALETDKTCKLDRSLIWGLAFLAGVASAVFTPLPLDMYNLLTDRYVPSRSQNDTVEQEEEDAA